MSSKAPSEPWLLRVEKEKDKINIYNQEDKHGSDSQYDRQADLIAKVQEESKNEKYPCN